MIIRLNLNLTPLKSMLINVLPGLEGLRIWSLLNLVSLIMLNIIVQKQTVSIGDMGFGPMDVDVEGSGIITSPTNGNMNLTYTFEIETIPLFPITLIGGMMIGVLAGSIAGDSPYASQAQLVSLEDKSLDEKIDYLKSIAEQ